MRLYLVQHGKAASKETDPLRPLTEEGLSDVHKVAKFIKRYPSAKPGDLAQKKRHKALLHCVDWRSAEVHADPQTAANQHTNVIIVQESLEA